MPRTLIVGASGTVGSELARLLAARDVDVVRATSRAPTAPDQVRLDLVAGTGLETAFEGVDRAFVLVPPGHTNQDVLLAPLIDEAQARGLAKVVLMTAMGADADESIPLRKAERRLEAAGLPWNVIRPNWFMQNFNSYWLHGIVHDDAIRLPVGRARGSFIDARDIAAVAAELLLRRDFDDRAFDLTGGRALDHDEVAAILSRTIGRPIRFEDVTPEQMRPGLIAAGLPADYADFLLVILGFFKLGAAERTTDAVQVITGHAPRRFEDYAGDYRDAWRR